jgi:SMC interacting uncharacterized protein involved in chromosome segregation
MTTPTLYMWILDEGEFNNDSLKLVEICNQVQEYLSTIDTLRDEIKDLREINEGLHHLVEVYRDDTTTHTNRTESHLGQIKQLESIVSKLRQELAQNESTVRFLHSRTRLLERDLKGQTEPKSSGTLESISA